MASRSSPSSLWAHPPAPSWDTSITQVLHLHFEFGINKKLHIRKRKARTENPKARRPSSCLCFSAQYRHTKRSRFQTYQQYRFQAKSSAIRCNGNTRAQGCTYKPSSCLLYSNHHGKRISPRKVAYLPCASKDALVGEDIPSSSSIFRESYCRNISKRKVEGWSCIDGALVNCDMSENSSGTGTQHEKDQVFKVFPEELISNQSRIQPITASHPENQVSMKDIDCSRKDLQLLLECQSNDTEHRSGNNVNQVSMHGTNDMEVFQVSNILPYQDSKQIGVSSKEKETKEDSSGFGRLKSVKNEAMGSSNRIKSNKSDHDALSIRKMLHALRSDLKKKYMELEKQRSVSALSVDEALAMIAALQKEKATIQMEAVQLQRMLEEKESFDENTINDLRDHLVKQEAEMMMLEKEMEVCRRKIVMCRLRDSGKEGIINETQIKESIISSMEERNNCSFLYDFSQRPFCDFRTQSMIVRDKKRGIIKQEVSNLVSKLTTLEADREVMKHTIELKKMEGVGILSLQEIK